MHGIIINRFSVFFSLLYIYLYILPNTKYNVYTRMINNNCWTRISIVIPLLYCEKFHEIYFNDGLDQSFQKKYSSSRENDWLGIWKMAATRSMLNFRWRSKSHDDTSARKCILISFACQSDLLILFGNCGRMTVIYWRKWDYR